jgi:hypothetical protein
MKNELFTIKHDVQKKWPEVNFEFKYYECDSVVISWKEGPKRDEVYRFTHKYLKGQAEYGAAGYVGYAYFDNYQTHIKHKVKYINLICPFAWSFHANK